MIALLDPDVGMVAADWVEERGYPFLAMQMRLGVFMPGRDDVVFARAGNTKRQDGLWCGFGAGADQGRAVRICRSFGPVGASDELLFCRGHGYGELGAGGGGTAGQGYGSGVFTGSGYTDSAGRWIGAGNGSGDYPSMEEQARALGLEDADIEELGLGGT